ncbi:hypothetical protein SAMN06297251_10810 [Fulvimarina manganoxydans]|uniref:Lipoprotein n=1 Tax=Fulvimarina manganoxydans TaxID=937218 RepID=A0A1W2BYD3_9HYPH|nr:hypothetical protein [Fulvimarina manganoxydans]MCK5931692.1 hypothetical protein [Fulvimarina manganoxydans]SMC77764.1 hypothetical protein SAMN06297251_10810 [Fulvimarina manganoxydans]
MTKPFRNAVLGVMCALSAGCTSTGSSTDMSSLPAPSNAALAIDAAVGAAPSTAGTSTEATQDLYYLEFRARTAESYGHTFAMFGKRNAQGQILTREVAGLHPASTSDIPYVLGHIIPVPSETGPSDGDLEDQYMTANYRIDLTKAEYDDVVGYIRELQASSPVWHAVLYNCSAFVGDIAQYMGLRTPPSLLFPETYINTLREMNT